MMSSAALGSLAMLVIEQGPYLGTSEGQRILIGYKLLDQKFEVAMRARHWKNSGLGLGMGFGIGFVAFGIVKG